MLPPRHLAVIDALLPSQSHPRLGLGLVESGFPQFYEHFRATAVWQMRLTFRLALGTMAWLAPLLIGRLPPLSWVPVHERQRALEVVATSRIYLLRQQMLMLKTVVCLHYGSLPEVRAAVGFPADSRGLPAEGEGA